MEKIRTGDLKLIQELNRSIILNMIREHGPLSRSEIARRNKISPSTVASAVQELMQEGLVCEDGTGLSSGGRKPVMVRFSPDNHFLIGVSISNSIISIAEINLEAAVLRKKEIPINDLDGDSVISRALHFIERFLAVSSNHNKCIGISIIVPGIVDAEAGVIHYNSKLRLKDVGLKEIFEERFKLKAWVENDTNAMVIAEKKFGKYGKYSNLSYITIGDGVGAGIILNGSIVRGGRGGAGEFGHTSVERAGIRCQCGNIGCLENYVSWPAIYSRILSSIKRGRTTAITDLVEGDITRISAQVFIDALNINDHLAMDITEETASYLAVGIVNLINLFNPDVIILGGDLAYNNELLIQSVNSYVSRHALPILVDELKISSTSLGKNAELVGAASVLLQDIFRFKLST